MARTRWRSRAVNERGTGEHGAHIVLFAEATQCAVAAVHLVAGRPGWQQAGGVQVGEDVHGQLRFGLEHQGFGYRGPRPAVRVVDPLAGQVRSGTGQGVPAAGSEGGVHDVVRVGHPTRAGRRTGA
jgi:hypothetical protein